MKGQALRVRREILRFAQDDSRAAAARLPRVAKPASRLAALLLLFALLGAACGGSDDEAPQTRLRAVASLEIFADMARQVGGDRVEVTALLPSGADPHTFELSPQRVVPVVEADVVFINGLGLEGNTEDVVRNNAEGIVIELTEGLDTLGDNPHLWLDVDLAARYVERIRDAFVEFDPEGHDVYEANAEGYLGVLRRLDLEMEAAIQTIPPESRKLVTPHDAFPYLAERYGLEVVAVVTTSPGQSPSARSVAELTEKLSSEHVPAVFREPQSNSDVLEQAAEEAGVEVFELLSDAFTEGVDSYVELMRFNMEQLIEGLGQLGFANASSGG